MSLHISPVKTYITVFATLLVLTAATVWAAFQNFGPFNDLVAMAIAGAKATVVVLFFMHVKYSSKLIGMVVIGTVIFLSILFIFLMLDGHFATWTLTPFSQYGNS